MSSFTDQTKQAQVHAEHHNTLDGRADAAAAELSDHEDRIHYLETHKAKDGATGPEGPRGPAGGAGADGRDGLNGRVAVILGPAGGDHSAGTVQFKGAGVTVTNDPDTDTAVVDIESSGTGLPSTFGKPEGSVLTVQQDGTADWDAVSGPAAGGASGYPVLLSASQLPSGRLMYQPDIADGLSIFGLAVGRGWSMYDLAATIPFQLPMVPSSAGPGLEKMDNWCTFGGTRSSFYRLSDDGKSWVQTTFDTSVSSSMNVFLRSAKGQSGTWMPARYSANYSVWWYRPDGSTAWVPYEPGTWGGGVANTQGGLVDTGAVVVGGNVYVVTADAALTKLLSRPDSTTGSTSTAYDCALTDPKPGTVFTTELAVDGTTIVWAVSYTTWAGAAKLSLFTYDTISGSGSKVDLDTSLVLGETLSVSSYQDLLLLSGNRVAMALQVSTLGGAGSGPGTIVGIFDRGTGVMQSARWIGTLGPFRTPNQTSQVTMMSVTVSGKDTIYWFDGFTLGALAA